MLRHAFESLATRGTERGADALIEELELQLTSEEGGIVPFVVLRPASKPTGWRRGLVVAVPTLLAVVIVAIGTLLVERVADEPRPEILSPPQTLSPVEELDAIAVFGGVVIADRETQGVRIVGEDSLALSTECCVISAMGDLLGGIVFQQSEAEILWVMRSDAGLESPVAVVKAGPGERVSIESVSVIDGVPSIVYLRRDANGKTVLSLLRLDSWEGFDVIDLDGRLVDRVSHSQGIYLVSMVDGTRTWFDFLDESGNPVEVPNNPRAEPAETLVSQGLVTPNGDTMVYIERRAEDATGGLADLVVFDLNSGVEISRHHVANLGDRLLTFDGERVVVARQRANPELPPTMIALHLIEDVYYTLDGSFGVTEP